MRKPVFIAFATSHGLGGLVAAEERHINDVFLRAKAKPVTVSRVQKWKFIGSKHPFSS
jgi:hypothetical protein